MNDNFTNIPDPQEPLAQKLNKVAEQTQVSSQFAAELEEELRAAHRPKTGWFSQVSPTLGWVALMVVLALVLSWSIKALIPSPRPAINNTPAIPNLTTPTQQPDMPPTENATPAIQEGGYDWRQSKLYLSAPLPQTPAQAFIYSLKEGQPVTEDMVLAKANQFGVQGSVFEVNGSTANQTGYMVTDGKQRVYIQSDLDYAYYSDYGAYSYMSGAKNISDAQAATVIDAFLKSHGLDFPYELENPHINPGMYYVLPLSPDGLPVYHDYNMPSRLEFTIDENSQVVLVSSYQDNYDAVGKYGIRSAEEAFRQILDQSNGMQNGVLEIMRSAGGAEAGFWSRSYPDNETITIYGQPASYPAAQPGGSPYVGIGQFTATGNTSGLENVDSSAYIEATGHFVTQNGIRKFNVNSWKVTDVPEVYISGSLLQDGDQIILSASEEGTDQQAPLVGTGKQYPLIDPPANLPLEMPEGSYLAVHGFLKDGTLNWDTIQYYPAGSGGGGGGGSGTGFYQLNLSGTPVPFPIPTSMPSVAQGNIEYTVKEGDTLDAIATSFGITPEMIFQANHMRNGDVLAPGTVLTIPVGNSNSGTNEYTVKEGDTCGSIATNFNVSIRSLISENNLAENCLIMVGDVLKIPDPSSTSSIVGQRVEGQRGTFMEVIERHADGSQQVMYNWYSKPEGIFFAVLEGSSLQNMEAYHNRPMDIWGTVVRVNEYGSPVIQVDRYEIPYPDLQFQILKGTQKVAELEGERVALFAASDGTTYAQLTSNGVPDITVLGSEGSEVELETLAIPGEKYGGYPTIRVYGGAMAVNPKDGQPIELTITADKPQVVDQSQPETGTETYVPPSLTIESVELVYYVPDPRTGRQSTGPDAKYLQPAWRFYGHYNDGSEVEFLVQALQQEFLLPELAPYTGPG